MWFTDDPGSVFISTLHSSFDRLLLHAVCQYLGLSSESKTPFAFTLRPGQKDVVLPFRCQNIGRLVGIFVFLLLLWADISQC